MYQKLYNTYLYYSFLRISFVLNLSICRLIKEEYNYHDYVKTFAVENVCKLPQLFVSRFMYHCTC